MNNDALAVVDNDDETAGDGSGATEMIAGFADADEVVAVVVELLLLLLLVLVVVMVAAVVHNKDGGDGPLSCLRLLSILLWAALHWAHAAGARVRARRESGRVVQFLVLLRDSHLLAIHKFTSL